MYQIIINKEFEYLDTKTVMVTGGNDIMTVSYEGKELFKLDIPDDLKNSFKLNPKKRGYIKKDENGDVWFTLIRYLDYHIHSEFSLLDGANKIKNIVKKSDGCTAITDHGVMFGVLEFFKQMDSANKKPIIGVEVYCETKDGEKKGNHMILLVKNEKGWKNICKMLSEAELNFYGKPHVTYDMLERYHEGLICTSACIGGEIPQNILSKDFDKACEIAEILQDIFGDDFYLEIQYHGIPEEEIVNNSLWDIGALNDIKIVGATDSHYTEKEDAYAHEVLLAIGTKKKMSNPDRYKFQGTGYHLHSGEEFEELFKDTPEIFENLLEIVDKCNFRFDLTKRYLPKFIVPAPFKSEAEYFEHLCWEGFEERFKESSEFTNTEYRDRLAFEIKQIIDTGFPGYFLIVWDYVNWAKDNGIYVGPGRGSCVGSLAAYCLKITDLDPIPYGLLFERFINPERVTLPDIDMDFEYERREDVIDYIKDKYGVDNVSNIITFGTLAARNVIRDVGRVLEKNSNMIDKLAKSIPAEPKMTIEKAFKESPDFRDMYNINSDAKEVIDIAKKLEGLARQKSQHACGIIISNAPIREFVPEVLIEDKKISGQKNRVAAFNMSELEELGLLKMDFLGLRNMSIIHFAVDSINDSIEEDDTIEDDYIDMK